MFGKLLKSTPDPRSGVNDLPYPHVDVFHWSPANGSVNFGDRLADIIVRQMLCKRGLSLDDQINAPQRLLAAGSVLHFSATGDHVWGTGWNGKIPAREFKARSLNVHAVMGPMTEEFLVSRGINVPKVYGDPALLIPHIFNNRFRVSADVDYVFVPNLHDLSAVRLQPNIVSPLWGWNLVVAHILTAKLVLASSLHGLIVAEAFGIPARYVRLSETEDLFKYKDYYLGSGRSEAEFTFANSIEEGLEMGGAQLPRYDATSLIESFPFDLWGG